MKLKKIITIFMLSFGLIQIKPLHAEIQEVTITWTAQECLGSCAQGLYAQFKKIPAVSEININQSAGRATLKWRPNAPFSYQSIDTAMRLIGLYINNIKVSVRGTVVHDSPTTFRVLSIGDHSSFTLLSVPTAAPNQYVVQNNVQNRTLPPSTINQLLQAQQNNQTVTVSGPLFEPWRSPPVYLIIEHISFSNK